MTDTACFVQFPHPGAEHRFAGDEMPWNVGRHGRKFLVAPGQYVDGDDQRREGEMVFWAEWEPPSRVERRWPDEDDLPRALHRPYWTRPPRSWPRQNTDPWVFGERMIYSNCKQTAGTPRRRTAMQSLPLGSLICFGSTRHDRFRVDTVFVVAGAQPWTPGRTEGLNVDEAFIVCTAQSLTPTAVNAGRAGCNPVCPPDIELQLTFYRGATIDNPVHGMYSFVPARPIGHPQLRFQRAAVYMPGLINPAVVMNPWGARRPLRIADVHEAWMSLRNQVFGQDLVLATYLATPPSVSANESIAATPRTSCRSRDSGGRDRLP
ncbi:hypothetical protein QRX60_24005 [Amycolatopsis mongoliensis]|uniref:Uncharacterized protein n=1 Tax=Amycolatopsis mongoliensis TaxID=715475 RepID=A0A9Y2NM36_9PSEU|nr:hypothetical protein [Amycolatopsis sp. 4-36]WIY06764.1 hypothetical protein QRX60_24005 [Amycolatopsis sp. 4-36]